MKTLKKSLLLTLLSSPFLMSHYAVADDSVNYSDFRAANTAINYSYINVELGDKSYDKLDDNITIIGISGQTLLNESFIFKMGYQAELLDTTFNSKDETLQNNLVNLGVGWRFPIFKSTDIEVDTHLLYNWYDDKLNNTGDQSDVGFRVGGTIHHGFGDSFDTSIGIHHEAINDSEVTSVELKLTKYITRYVGVGLNGSIADSHSELGDMAYIGVHLNLAFY